MHGIPQPKHAHTHPPIHTCPPEGMVESKLMASQNKNKVNEEEEEEEHAEDIVCSLW